MATDRIRIQLGEARRIAASFQSRASESRDMSRSLERDVESLRTNFEGVAARSFYDQFVTWKSQMEQFSLMLEEISGKLNNTASRLEQADAEAASRMRA